MFQSNFRICPIVIAIGVLAMCLTSGAEIPRYINYQGKVTDSGGTPVADGNYTMQFRIYDTETGGSLLWDSNNQSVSLSDGIANVILGESSQPTLGLDFDADYWLLVTFEGTDQSPRVRLTSAGYSYMASGLVPGTVITGSSAESPLFAANNTATGDYAYGGSFKSASAGGVGVDGIASATTGETAGVRGTVFSTGGSGVIGHSNATTGQSCGVIGTTSSIGGRGVYGYAASTTGNPLGVYGLSNATSGMGVFGEAASSTGITHGVLGVVYSSEGSGVYGLANATTGNNHGVYGLNLSVEGSGVYGLAVASTGTNYGVFGATNSPSGYAGYFSGNTRVTGDLTVDGTLTGSGLGDITAVNAGTGLDGGGATGSVTLDIEVPLALAGTSSSPIIKGTNNGSSNGIEGETHSTSGRGMLGIAWATSGCTRGVQGSTMSTYGRGVHGAAEATTGENYGGYFESKSTNGTGVYGVVDPSSNADRFGVYGYCFPSENWGIGVKGEGGYRGVYGVSSHTSGSYTTYGVYGEASGAAVNYGVYASGDMGASGSKTAVVRTADGPKAVYCQESTEVWFEDFGTGVIQNGLATVRLAADFLQTVTINDEHPVKVFVTPKADIGRWWVQDTGEAFELHAPDAPDGAMFDYRVVAKRIGYENLRLSSVPGAYADHFLYPALSDVPANHQAEWLKAEALKQESVHDPAVDR